MHLFCMEFVIWIAEDFFGGSNAFQVENDVPFYEVGPRPVGQGVPYILCLVFYYLNCFQTVLVIGGCCRTAGV